MSIALCIQHKLLLLQMCQPYKKKKKKQENVKFSLGYLLLNPKTELKKKNLTHSITKKHQISEN